MKIEADFSQISHEFQHLEDGEYQVTIEKIEEGETRDSKLPTVTVVSRINDPNHPDRENFPVYDRITLRTKKGEPNRIGLGHLKAYAIATLGEEQANSPEGIDTDEMIGAACILVIKQRSYKQDGEDRLTNDVKKVLPA